MTIYATSLFILINNEYRIAKHSRLFSINRIKFIVVSQSAFNTILGTILPFSTRLPNAIVRKDV